MYRTHVRPVRDLRNNYAELAEKVRQHDHVIITHNGKSESVLVSFEVFEGFEKYLHMRYAIEKLDELDLAGKTPITLGSLTPSQVDAELQKGVDSIRCGDTRTAQEVHDDLHVLFGI